MHKKLEDHYTKAEDVVNFHLQTVWEGQHANKPETQQISSVLETDVFTPDCSTRSSSRCTTTTGAEPS